MSRAQSKRPINPQAFEDMQALVSPNCTARIPKLELYAKVQGLDLRPHNQAKTPRRPSRCDHVGPDPATERKAMKRTSELQESLTIQALLSQCLEKGTSSQEN